MSRDAGRARPVFVYGAGGFGREVAWLAETSREPCDLRGYIDDSAGEGRDLHGKPVRTLDAVARDEPGASFVVAVGSPAVRETLTARALAAGLHPATLVHRSVEMSSTVTIGVGSVVCAGCILTVNVTVHPNVQINLDCTIGHDAVLEEYVTLAPGVHVSGWVRLERGCYVGTGAVILNGESRAPVVIGAGAIVGAGAVVTRSVAPGTTVMGVPARARG